MWSSSSSASQLGKDSHCLLHIWSTTLWCSPPSKMSATFYSLFPYFVLSISGRCYASNLMPVWMESLSLLPKVGSARGFLFFSSFTAPVCFHLNFRLWSSTCSDHLRWCPMIFDGSQKWADTAGAWLWFKSSLCFSMDRLRSRFFQVWRSHGRKCIIKFNV